mmetsp:Transcript_34413/g.47962  ORF Transcript_34413/g.47962 Transcript_34413/m.47962 type:complete len:140 (+) Transcript_34413:394-813(+)
MISHTSERRLKTEVSYQTFGSNGQALRRMCDNQISFQLRRSSQAFFGSVALGLSYSCTMTLWTTFFCRYAEGKRLSYFLRKNWRNYNQPCPKTAMIFSVIHGATMLGGGYSDTDKQKWNKAALVFSCFVVRADKKLCIM